MNGYTDDIGTDAYDLALSQARALAVAEALQAALVGVPVTLQPQGFVKADPVPATARRKDRLRTGG